MSVESVGDIGIDRSCGLEVVSILSAPAVAASWECFCL